MNREALIAIALSLAAVLGTVEKMRDMRLTNATHYVESSPEGTTSVKLVKGIFPAFARHELNAVMSVVKANGSPIEKQEAERAAKLLSKISEKESFNGDQLAEIKSAAQLVISATRNRMRVLLMEEIRLLEPRPITGTPSLDILEAIRANAHRRIADDCHLLAWTCTNLIKTYREIGPFTRGRAMIPIVASEITEDTPPEKLLLRQNELVAYAASLNKMLNERRETAASSPRHFTPRFRAA